ncbi:MAG: hypothetical protein K2W99_07220 [Chthoniobacterales bacterium]|nr:hypothetical protein [Chthoniobacterales bacterium]
MMKRRIVHEIGKSQRLSILELLKRSANGMAVADIALSLSMSYMGIKAHCIEMHQQGYLETWRQPGMRGRPLMYYRLTEKAHELFAEENYQLVSSLLQVSKTLFGPTAPLKLLMLHFRSLATNYQERIKKESVMERARALSLLREADGSMSQFEEGTPWKIIESHDLYQNLLTDYPEVEALERQMISDVIGVPVRRDITRVAGLYRAVITPE